MRIQVQLWIALFWCLSHGAVMSQSSSLYFFYDPTCVQKMDYERLGTFHDIAFTDYYLTISNEKKVIFRVIKDQNYLNRELVREIPEKPYMCEDRAQITDELINSINQARKVAYIVVEFDNQYAIYEVRTVSTLTENQGVVRYKDEKHGFEYNAQTSKMGDLLNPTSNKDRNIFFELSGKQNCLSMQSLKVVSKHIEDPIAYINVVSGVGIYKIFTEEGEMSLKTINGIPTDGAINRICSGGNNVPIVSTTPIKVTPTTISPTPSIIQDTVGLSAIDKALWESKQKIKGGTAIIKKDNTGTYGSTDWGTTTTTTTTTTTIGANDTLTGGVYLVKSQESLYVISNKFGISINRLMEINGLKSYALGLNQPLKVVDDGTVPMRNHSPLVKLDNVKKTKTTIHVVEQGQTLYGISVQYGLKLPELYKLNKQLQSEFIDINQQLVVGVQEL